MKRFLIVAAMACATLLPMTYLAAHCEVPCGIYDDGARFAEMLEDQTTIAKAIASINDMSYDPNAEKINQMGRWITTKEAHATHTQHVIAQYFMTQRIKADDQAYVSKLTAAHGVMVAAMKCKQSTDPATADALKSAILTFKKAYGGKGSGKK